MHAARLVLALTRAALADRPLDAAPAGTAPAWDAVLDLAERHRVLPLVQQALRDAKSWRLPEAARTRLDAAARQDAVIGLRLEHALRTLLATLCQAGIPTLVIKGPALAHQVYPRPELRPYGDLDLVCHPADYPRLYRALLAAGYQSPDPAGDLRPNADALESYFPRPFTSPVADAAIEIHFDILQLGLFERQHSEFWRDAEWLDAAGLRMRVLAPAHQVLQVAAHVHRHGYARLLWLVDLDRVVRRFAPRLDGRSLMVHARAEGMGALLRHALAVAGTALGTPALDLGPPSAEERALAPLYRRLWPVRRVLRLEQREHHRLVRFTFEGNGAAAALPSLLLLGRRREKWRVLRAHALASALGRGRA